jgi:quercetin dioxygenase-like cupin family protein
MHTTSPFVLNPGESRGAPLPLILGTGVSIKLASADTARSYTAMECLIAPQAGPPLHRHSREDEAFYVLEGEYKPTDPFCVNRISSTTR